MHRSRTALTLALCAGYFLVLLDVTIVNVALPQVRTGLDASGPQLAWVVDAYPVPLAALLLASGAIGDRIGHRRVVLLGFTCFGVASSACAIAPSAAVLIVARAVQGVGAALMLPGTLALLVTNAPDTTSRTRLVGLWAAVGGAALPAGPLIGGLVVQACGWRAVYWVGVPVIALAMLPVWRIQSSAGCGRARGGAVDWPGAALLAAALAALVAAIIQAAGAPWLASVLLVCGAVAGAAFVAVERRTSRPLITIPVRGRVPLGAACLVAGVMNLCVLGSLFVLTQLLQTARGLDPLAAGLATLPALLPMPLLATPAGRLSSRIGVWHTGFLGLLIASSGFAGMAVSVGVVGSGNTGLLLSMAVWGTGLGILTPAIVSAALHAIPGAPGVASGASNTSRQTGGALGVAIFAAIAGSPHQPGFGSQAAWLFGGAAGVFVAAALVCAVMARRGRSDRVPRQSTAR